MLFIRWRGGVCAWPASAISVIEKMGLIWDGEPKPYWTETVQSYEPKVLNQHCA